MRVLVTGATGYIGGRLVPDLLEAGHEVRVLVRGADSIRGRAWEKQVETRRGDLLDPNSLQGLIEGVDAAYYLVHSMYAGGDFEAQDRKAARNFVAVCEGEGDTLKQVIYLGGLQPDQKRSAESHLRSRAEVGRILEEGLPGRVTEFRAGPIIGSGSASFEMVRYLTERLPVMVTPKWVKNAVQPIAVRDVLSYLIQTLEVGQGSKSGGLGIVDIGSTVLTFKQMMLGVAEARGLRRWIIPTPFLAPKLAARWVGAVTPIPNALAVPLIEGVTEPLTGDTSKAERLFPEVNPIGFDQAVRFALDKTERGEVETRWSGAIVSGGISGASGVPEAVETIQEDREGLARDQRTLHTDVPVRQVFDAVCAIGGKNGWYTYRWAWWLRGAFDALLGGPGLRRGRRHPQELFEGEAVDWWRVDKIRRPSEVRREGEANPFSKPALLRLRAEMKLPGKAWLQWEVDRVDGCTQLKQTAMMLPKGLPGTLYWYVLLPMHGFIFPSLLKSLEKEARKRWKAESRQAVQSSADCVST
jgi:uncharacterized protein YbjT (DUF2867 family)